MRALAAWAARQSATVRALGTAKSGSLYAPIEATIIGERPEIFPYLGTSRLEDSLQRYPVHMTFHGHAHQGTLEGKTRSGIPVFNVAMPLLLRQQRQAFRIFELPPIAAEELGEKQAQLPRAV